MIDGWLMDESWMITVWLMDEEWFVNENWLLMIINDGKWNSILVSGIQKTIGHYWLYMIIRFYMVHTILVFVVFRIWQHGLKVLDL